MKNPWIVIGVIVVLLIGGSVVYSNFAAKQNNEGITTNTEHIKGNPNASVVLVEYSDFQCPACAAFHPVVADVLKTFGDSIRFEYKHFPLPIHPLAESAARAAEAAGQQGKFFEFHDKLFEEQNTWSKSPNPNAHFMRYAEELGLDTDRFARALKSSLLRDEVRADRDEARAKNLTGTPTFFLNGEQMKIDTYQDFFDQIAKAIDPTYGMGTTTTPNAPTASSSDTTTAPEVHFGL